MPEQSSGRTQRVSRLQETAEIPGSPQSATVSCIGGSRSVHDQEQFQTGGKKVTRPARLAPMERCCSRTDQSPCAPLASGRPLLHPRHARPSGQRGSIAWRRGSENFYQIILSDGLIIRQESPPAAAPWRTSRRRPFPFERIPRRVHAISACPGLDHVTIPYLADDTLGRGSG